MLRFKQTARVSASAALKSQYFASSVDGGETANISSLSSLSSLTSSETDQENDQCDHSEVVAPSGV